MQKKCNFDKHDVYVLKLFSSKPKNKKKFKKNISVTKKKQFLSFFKKIYFSIFIDLYHKWDHDLKNWYQKVVYLKSFVLANKFDLLSQASPIHKNLFPSLNAS